MRATPPPQLIDSPFDLASTTAIAPSPGKYEIMVELSSFSGEDYDRNAERIFCDEVNRVRDIMDEIEERLLGGRTLMILSTRMKKRLKRNFTRV